MSNFGVVLFHTTTSVMQAEKALLKAGVFIKLIPTPREFSSDCGIAIRFDWIVSKNIEAILTGSAIEFDTINLMGVPK